MTKEQWMFRELLIKIPSYTSLLCLKHPRASPPCARFTGLSISISSTTDIVKRSLSASANKSRTSFEEEYHLATHLSKVTVDTKQVQQWKRQIQSQMKQQNLKSSGQLNDNVRWYPTRKPLERCVLPGYEVQALKAIHSRSFDCNVLLEIRDVRLPASCHHPSFTRLARHRLHLIVYTHADLIDIPTRNRVEQWTKLSWPDAYPIFVDSREHRKIDGDNSNAGGGSYALMYESLLHHLDSMGGLNVALTVGVANTGKSSVLSCLLRHARNEGHIPQKIKSSPVLPSSKKKKAKSIHRQLRSKGGPEVEDKPGKTQKLTEYLLRESPRAFFLDVPGLTPPPFFFEERPEAWFGMAAANLLSLSKKLLADPRQLTILCDYVLHCLNRDANFVYVKKLNLQHPTTDIEQVLEAMGGKKIIDPDARRQKQCQNFLKYLNTGNLGSVILDDLTGIYQPFRFQNNHFQKNNDNKEENDFYDDEDEWWRN